MTATMTNLELSEAVDRAKAGHRSEIRCPAHDDNSPSLSVAPGTDQPVTLHCHANCTTEAILEAGGLEWADVCAPFDDARVSDDGEVWTPSGNASHVYPYRLADGTTSFEVLRVPTQNGKTFMQRHRSAETGRYVWNTQDCTRVLYRLPEVMAAVAAGETIYVVEGEKDVHTLLRKNLVATCNSGGAGKWTEDYSKVLAGANVVIIADADATGRAHARAVRESLETCGCTVTTLEPASGAKDVSDHLRQGGTMDSLLTVKPGIEHERARFGVDVLDVIVRKISDVQFVIPGTLARRERLLLTGFEGMGKSTLIRQMAVQIAGGIHPFSLADIPPMPVLVIDAENEPGQTLESWQQLIGLAAHYERPVERGMLTILEEWDSSDLDLAGPDGMEWLHERINAYQPALVVMGPLTNMVGRDLKDDEPVRRLKRAVNSARTICGSAFVMEHHAPHKAPMDKERAVRPYGSSMFLKWPDYGYGLKPVAEIEGTFDWQRTRWPRVRTRIWPDRLRNGNTNHGEWPWMEAEPGS